MDDGACYIELNILERKAGSLKPEKEPKPAKDDEDDDDETGDEEERFPTNTPNIYNPPVGKNGSPAGTQNGPPTDAQTAPLAPQFGPQGPYGPQVWK